MAANNDFIISFIERSDQRHDDVAERLSDITNSLSRLTLLTETQGKQQDTMSDTLSTFHGTLARLTTTVEIHEKRSTNLENIVNNCRGECNEKFEKADQTDRKIDTFIAILKWSGAVCGALIAIAGLGFGIIQAMGSVKEYGFIGLFQSSEPTKPTK